jgi:hypothetical protein
MPKLSSAKFGEEWISVWSAGTDIVVPQMCACCLSTQRLKSKRVEFSHRDTTFGVFDYPMCHDCVRHSEATNKAMAIAGPAGVGVAIVVSLLFVGTVKAKIGLVIFFLTFFAVSYPLYRLLLLNAPKQGNNCVGDGSPVWAEPDPYQEIVKKSDISELALWRQHSKAKFGELGKRGLALRFYNFDFVEKLLKANGSSMERVEAFEAPESIGTVVKKGSPKVLFYVGVVLLVLSAAFYTGAAGSEFGAQQLLDAGETVTATVYGKELDAPERESNWLTLHLSFENSSGKQKKVSVRAPLEKFRLTSEGEEVQLIYNPFRIDHNTLEGRAKLEADIASAKIGKVVGLLFGIAAFGCWIYAFILRRRRQ